MGFIPARLTEADAALAGDSALAAAFYAALGLAVFPLHGVDAAGVCLCGKDCGRDAGKHPRTHNGLRDATRDPRVVGGWWRRTPSANVAVATGPPSGVWVLDADPEHGGLESIGGLEAEHGEISPTWCVETGGDGLHLWFRLDGAAIPTSAGRLGPGLDVRGHGGYVVVPPSRHRSGQRYRWADAWHPALVDLAPAPPWLLGLVREPRPEIMVPPDRSPIERKAGGNHSQALPKVIAEGSRNAALTGLAGAMRRKGAGEHAIVAALLVENAARCRPPLPEAEIARIARSVCRYTPENPARLVRSPQRSRGFVEFVGGKAVSR
jgi:putative DNA primase/helicase